MENKVFLWIAAAASVALSLPYLAMQYDWIKPDPANPNDIGVSWSTSDFMVAWMLIFGAASLFVAAARVTAPKNRLLMGMILSAVFLLVWAELAVGVFTNLGS